jgi:diguanylate cyclase (GGDEF)-like protein/PAS domain S-box-containing protein
LIFCALFAFAAIANAGTLSLNEIGKNRLLGKELKILADRSGNLTLDLVRSSENLSKWTSAHQKVFNQGFTSTAYWFQFSLVNQQRISRDALLEVGYPLLDYVDVYLVRNDSADRAITHYRGGDMLPYSDRLIDHPNFLFPLTIDAGSSIDIFMRVQSTSSMQVPLTLWGTQYFLEKEQPKLLLAGIFIGLMAIMAIYNLFLFAAMQERSYLYFALCITNYVMVEAILTGIAYPYLWPDNLWWNDKSLVVVSCLALASLAQFSKTFLELQHKSPDLARLFDAYTVLTVTLASISLFMPYTITIRATAIFVALIPLSAYILGIKLWIKGLKSARFFCIAFSFFVIAAIVFVLNKYGVFPRNVFTESSIHIGSALVVCLLSLALADRFNVERQGKEQAQHQAIINLEKYRKLYKNSLEGIFRVSLDGKPLAVNPAFVKLIGCSSLDEFFAKVNNLGDYIPSDYGEYQRMVSHIEKSRKIIGYEMQGQRLDGSSFWCAVFARLVDDDGESSYIEGSIIDITERKQSEQRLSYLASHDPLTGLINRHEFDRRMQNALIHSKKNLSEQALLSMDLDQFKIINDTCGHDAGDELLRQISHLFCQHVRQRDSLARLGGDEFSILLEQCSLDKATEIAQLLRSDVNAFRFVWEQKTFSLGVSIGLVPITAHSESVAQLLSLADTACYQAKDNGRNRIYVYNEQEGKLERRQTEMQLVSTVSDAIKNDNLSLYRQPIESLQSNHLNGERYEILVRMHSKNELILPGAFLPAAERYNTIVALDRWVVKSFFTWLSDHPDYAKNLQMASINLSGQSLSDEELFPYIQKIFREHTVDPMKICFEITESIAISNLRNTLNFMEKIKLIGVKFALDDFGSGFSSYGYLKTLPIDYIKIDGNFICNIVNSRFNYTMVKSITEIAHAMDVDVIAEFVENEAIYLNLKELGINFVQGYYIGKPQSLINY